MLNEHTIAEINWTDKTGYQLRPGEPVPGCMCEDCAGPEFKQPENYDNIPEFPIIEVAQIIKLKKLSNHGREWKAICPFHSDRNPSLYLNPGKNLYHCFSCGAGGDSLTLYMKTREIGFKEAVNELRGTFEI